MQKRLMSRQEAADYAGLTKYMVDRLVRDGKDIAVRIHGRVYIHRERLDALIDNAATLNEGMDDDDDQ